MLKVRGIFGRLGFAFTMIKLRRDSEITGRSNPTRHFLSERANAILVLPDDNRRKRSGSVRLSDIESHRTPIDLDRFPRGFHGLLQLRMSLPLQYYLEVLLSMP